MKLGRNAILFFFSLHLLSSGFAGSKTGADFLKIPIGAEPAGLGQAYTALAQGVNALNWNPAGLAKTPALLGTPSVGMSFSHQDLFTNTNLDHLGVVLPAQSSTHRLAWGLDFIRLSYGQQDRRDADRQTTGSFDAYDLSASAAIAQDLGRFQWGTQLKMIRENLAGIEAQGFAADVGILARTPNPHLSLGASVRNLGPQMHFIDESFQLPLTLSLGAALHVASPLSLAIELQDLPYQHQRVLSLGSEFFVSSSLALRAGYLAKLAETVQNNQTSETNRGSFTGVGGLAGGVGLQFKQFMLDYSITPFGELGNTQSITVATYFGGATREEIKSPATAPAAAPAPAEPDKESLQLTPPPANEPWWDHLKP